MILAVETSSTACSVALQPEKGKNRIIHRWVEGRQEHSKQLLPFIKQCLEEASGSFEAGLLALEQVLISNGPGSYTGLRIAGSAMRGLFFRRSIPVKAVSTLSMLAVSTISHIDNESNSVLSTHFEPEINVLLSHGSVAKFGIHALIDARGGFYYHRGFEWSNHTLYPTTEAKRVSADELRRDWEHELPKILLGSGATDFEPEFANHGVYVWEDIKRQFHALNLLKVLQLNMADSLEDISIETLEPYYLGNNQVNNTPITR